MSDDAADRLQAVEEAPDFRAGDAETDFQALHEIVGAAHAKLDRTAWDYLIGGSETETTIKRNRYALDSVGFRPRVLRNVAAIDPSASFLGLPTALPVILCSVGSLGTFHPRGGEAVASAATRFGIPVFVSSSIPASMEAVARAAPRLKVFQLYTRGDAAWIDAYINRARESGYRELCITVDNAVASRRERDISKRFVKSWRRTDDAAAFQAAFAWDDVQRIIDVHGMPLILKGIGTAEDADIACRMGVAAVHISNHGGRQLDHGRGTLDVLPEVVEAVAGRARIIVDGGFSRGTDVVKAIAMGADTVGIGRLYIYGLAAAGAEGVFRVLQLLQSEIVSCMGLLGVTRLSQLGREHVLPVQSLTSPHVHSAFPLLSLPDQAYDYTRAGSPGR